MDSEYSIVEVGPSIKIFDLMKTIKEDTFPKKVDLTIGMYKDHNGKSWVLPVVQKVEREMAENPDHDYLQIVGIEEFITAANALLLGADNPAILEKRTFGIQCLSGTGSLRVGADFLHKHLKKTVFYYSNPTWENHHLLFLHAGFETPCTYRYWDPKTLGIDIEGLLEDLENAPEGAVIILQPCCHNPTGCDLTQEQWKKIAKVMRARKLFPFFDFAYHGFASGDFDKDSWAVRYFVDNGFELLCAQSFGKNFGLYAERVGNLTVVMNDTKHYAAIKSQMILIARGMYTNPPAFGAKIVLRILTDETLRAEWKENVKTMVSRVLSMRKALYDELIALKTPRSWEHIITQIGMFSYTGFTSRQIEYLMEKHHVYLPYIERISVCSLTLDNVKYVASAFHDAVIKFPA